MIYKTVADVVAALTSEFKLPTYTKPSTSFTYVPWTESKKLLDEVFGIFGWATTEPRVTFAATPDQGKAVGVYTVSFGLRLFALDDGEVVEKMLPCIGQGVSYGADDNAAKSAMSDALSRGVKMLGEAFGFSLYEKGAPATAAAAPRQANPTAPRPSANGAAGGKGPSEKQRAILTGKLGFSEEQVAAMPFAEWKGALDNHFASASNGW